MALSVYEQVAREADTLPSDEQLRLIARLAERLAVAGAAGAAMNRPRWEDFAGSASASMCGEDAQHWVTRTRQESDQQRVTP